MSNYFKLGAFFFLFTNGYAQPPVTEDRMYIKFSPDVVKVEWDIYLPTLSGDKPRPFITWEYGYRSGLLISTKSISAANKKLWTEQYFEYDSTGKLIKDSSSDLSFPKFDSYTLYQYNKAGLLTKSTNFDRLTGNVERTDKYNSYNGSDNYKRVTEIFGDDFNIKYTSTIKNGLKISIAFKGAYLPITYSYDSIGRLVIKNSRRYFYKLDSKGNPIASVEIESMGKVFNFMRITYADGTITGSLKTDEEFINEWSTKK
jgi:hypothetical protein